MADHSLLGAPTISAEGFKKVLCEHSAPTPLVDIANDLYAHAVREGANPAVVLGIYGRESSFGRTGMALTTKAIGNERPRDLPKGHPSRDWDGPVFDRDKGRFPSLEAAKREEAGDLYILYADYRQAWTQTVRRLKEYATVGARRKPPPLSTVGKAIPVWAPSSDRNDVQGYIDYVNSAVEQWAKKYPYKEEKRVATNGWCPFARKQPITNKSFGYPRGTRGQNKPIAVVNHRTASRSPDSDDEPYFLSTTEKSVTFLIKRSGEIVQFLSIFDAHWGNGKVVLGPHSPEWLRELDRRDINPNTRTVSIEHQAAGGWEGFTDEQIVSSCQLNAWLSEVLDLPKSRDHHIGHYAIDWKDKKFCPWGDNQDLFPFDRIMAAVQAGGQVLKFDGDKVDPATVPTQALVKVVIDDSTNIRRRPHRTAKILEVPDQVVPGEIIARAVGEEVGGSKVWYVVRGEFGTYDFGYVHESLVREMKDS